MGRRAKALTPEERNWIDSMQTLLDQCPSERLGFYTTGDHSVTIFDKKVRDKWHQAPGCPATDIREEISQSGASLNAGFHFPEIVESRAG